MIKFFSKNPQERMGLRVAHRPALRGIHGISSDSRGSHQTLPQPRSTKTGGNLKLQNHLMDSAITFTSWDLAIFRSTFSGEVLIPSPFFQGWKAPATRQLFEVTTSSNLDFLTPPPCRQDLNLGRSFPALRKSPKTLSCTGAMAQTYICIFSAFLLVERVSKSWEALWSIHLSTFRQ